MCLLYLYAALENKSTRQAVLYAYLFCVKSFCKMKEGPTDLIANTGKHKILKIRFTKLSV